ncbi:MAG: bifunctional glutamate N-acetyltransferase/amino-acid acetyltransferase ArgJ [Alphaproteobacteria bacterium]
MTGPVSPFAPATPPVLPALAGVRMATAQAGIVYKDRTDLLLVRFDGGASVAGVFTRSQCASAPVDWCRAILAGGRADALVVNSGNANAFTGVRGRVASELSAKAAGDAVGCDPETVFLASTGVIGEPMDPEPFQRCLGGLADAAVEDGYLDAACAIMTTDTYPKLATRTVEIAGQPVTLNGIAKGSGMIAPDMATMLSFVFTDAEIAPADLQTALERAVSGSFNAITVDSDTSTSDTLLAFATGSAGDGTIVAGDDASGFDLFADTLSDLCADLAGQVIRDCEGLTKVAQIKVTSAAGDASARKIALSIANSPLVKTALAGEDANWGRVVMAVGKAGEPADRDRLSIWFGPHRVAANGERDPGYSEAVVSDYMKGTELEIRVDLGLGAGESAVWTCDLTHGYVVINADYRS